MIGNRCRYWVSLGLGLTASCLAWPAMAQTLDLVQFIQPSKAPESPSFLVRSHDGTRLYVLDRTADSLAVFTRDAATGRLTFVETYLARSGTFSGFIDLTGPAVSHDGRFLYVGASTQTGELHSGSPVWAPVVVTLAALADGRLEFLRVDRLGSKFRRVAVPPVLSPGGEHLYAVEEPARLYVFHREAATGRLRPVQELLFEGDVGPHRALVVAPDGRHLYLAQATPVTENSVRIFMRDAETGKITATRLLPEESVAPELYVRDFTLTGDGLRAYVGVASDSGALVVFRRNPATGHLLDPKVVAREEDDFSASDAQVVLSPEGRHVYQCREDVLHVYRSHPVQQGLVRIQTLKLPPSLSNYRECDLELTSDGRDLYATRNRSIVRVERHPSSGTLTLRESTPEVEGGVPGVDRISGAAGSPDGRHIYAARENQVLLFARDESRLGTLELLNLAAVPGSPAGMFSSLALSPDGRNLYASTRDELLILARDLATGSLVEMDREPTGASLLEMTADGLSVYARVSDSAVAAYRRDPAAGTLTQIQVFEVPNAGIHSRLTSLASSHDSANLYVTVSDFSFDSGAILVLTRDTASGHLRLAQQLLVDGCGEDLHGVKSINVSPDGRHVYVSTGVDDRIGLFDRDPRAGSLAVRSCLGSAARFRLSPDGLHLYGVDIGDGSILTTYRRNPDSGLHGRGERFDINMIATGTPVISPDGSNVYLAGYHGIAVFLSSWIATTEFPDFRFEVSIDTGSGRPLVGRAVAECLPETVCVQGALPGRTEALLRIVGPKPNGRLWPTLVKFSTSPIAVEIEQLSTGEVRSYLLKGAAPGSDELPGLFDRDGFPVDPASPSRILFHEMASRESEAPPPAAGEPFTSDQIPGFRFQVRLSGGGQELPARPEASCFEETLCVSGAVPGRSELFLRIVGPKPNGYLWPTLVRTTTSTVEVWIEQASTGKTNYYRLDGATPGSMDLTGLFDREGFLP